MNEINEEVKLTLNLMQTDIDDGAHDELQYHLMSLLDIKRNELQQRLVERSWAEPVTHDQAKPLTTEELKAGGWWCGDVSEECRLVFVNRGINTVSDSWIDEKRAGHAYKWDSNSNLLRSHSSISLHDLKKIHRIGNEFYWGEK